jgi:potassium efflux system protein
MEAQMNDVISAIDKVLETRLFIVADTTVNVATLLIFLAIVIGTFWISHLIQKAMLRAFRMRGLRDDASISVFTRLIHYFLLAMGFGIAIHTVGIDLTALFAAGAIFAIGLGFAMQNIAQNFVSGIILLVERIIKPGDVLEVDGEMVRIVRMATRATVARTLDEEEVIIPNSDLVQSKIKNYTLRDSLFRLRAPVGVLYSSDMRVVRDALKKAANDMTWRTDQVEPVVLMTEFGDSSVNFEVSVWIENPWEVRKLRSELNEAIWWALKDAEVTIAFPQLDVHFDPPIVESFNSMSGR